MASLLRNAPFTVLLCFSGILTNILKFSKGKIHLNILKGQNQLGVIAYESQKSVWKWYMQ